MFACLGGGGALNANPNSGSQKASILLKHSDRTTFNFFLKKTKKRVVYLPQIIWERETGLPSLCDMSMRCGRLCHSHVPAASVTSLLTNFPGHFIVSRHKLEFSKKLESQLRKSFHKTKLEATP